MPTIAPIASQRPDRSRRARRGLLVSVGLAVGLNALVLGAVTGARGDVPAASARQLVIPWLTLLEPIANATKPADGAAEASPATPHRPASSESTRRADVRPARNAAVQAAVEPASTAPWRLDAVADEDAVAIAIADADPDAASASADDTGAPRLRYYRTHEVEQPAEPELADDDWNLDAALLAAAGVSRLAYEVYVDASGAVRRASVLEPTDLDAAPRDALEQRLRDARARPARRHGEAVPSLRRIEMTVADGAS